MTKNQPSAANNWTRFFLVLIIVAVLGYQWYQNQGLQQDPPQAGEAVEVDRSDRDIAAGDAGRTSSQPQTASRQPSDRQTDNRQADDRQSDIRQTDDRQTDNRQTDDRQPSNRQTDDLHANDRSNNARSTRQTAGNQSKPDQVEDSFLKPAGGRNLKSPAGLIYGMGPRGEHRVDHVMRHATDDLSRPAHGVFDGDRDDILKLIDQAYEKTKTKSRQVQTEESDNNTIYTVNMGRRIGFEGGQRGQRNNNRALTRVRLVLRDDRVITAYPYR